MKLTHTLLLCTTLLGSAAVTRAQNATPPDRKPFGNATLPEFLKPYDVDKDGKLSVEERQAYQKAILEAAKEKAKDRKIPWDANGDGKVDEEERKVAIEAMRKKIEDERAKRFDELDKNDDGFLSIAEFTRVPNIREEIANRILEHLDTAPKDGKISKDEFLAALKPPTPPVPPRPPVPPVPPVLPPAPTIGR